MELPQPRTYGTQDRKPTHNFLSLYSPTTNKEDPSSSLPGGSLETHDFLQPLEQEGKNMPAADVEHILPGGIGTYSINHISCISQSQSQNISNAERVMITAAQSSGSDKNEENSNCSSHSGFSLWEESAGKTGNKENIAGNRPVIREGGPWMTSMERPSQSSAHNHPTTISSLLSSRQSLAQKNPIVVDMLKYNKRSNEDEDDEQQEFVIKKEPSSHYKGDSARQDQKPNTPRSKHSATEQRRRSKINDRFSMLRELIPHGDQKRDKASFLLEVFEYIQFLQEKVHKYEDSCRNDINSHQRHTKGFKDQPLVQTNGSEPALVSTSYGSLNHHQKHESLLDCDLSSHEQIGQHPLTNKQSSFLAPIPSALAESAHTTSQLWQTAPYINDCTVAGDKLKEQGVTIESGTISISTIYSQGLLSTLTQALQNSGVDLSQANISVQIDLGKRVDSSTPILKDNEFSGMHERSRLASTREEKSDKALKRFKTNIN